jgi:DNA-binding PadR family transcriptional regulator
MAKPLNTTAYAILGLLALRPWTAYELAAEMRHCFEYFWPRADARVYDEARGLVARGLAQAEQGSVGKRPRTTYAITPEGRQALADWLARPSPAIALEFEGLLKVFFARFGTREQLLATLAQARADAEEMLRVAAVVRQAYLDCRAPFQEEQGHIRAFIYDFLVDYMETVYRWTQRTQAAVEAWGDLSPAGKGEQALALIEGKPPARVERGEESLSPVYPGMPRRRRRAAS